MTTPAHTIIKFVCSRCGSDAVRMQAYAEWWPEHQEWVLPQMFFGPICLDCWNEDDLEEVYADAVQGEKGTQS